MFLSIVLPLHLELLLGGAKHLNFISPPRPNPSVYLIPYFQIPLHLPAHSRCNMGLWYSNGLHHLWCCTPSCYTINNACTCRLCGERQPTKSHLLSCRTSTLASHIVIRPTPVNVNKVVNVLYYDLTLSPLNACLAQPLYTYSRLTLEAFCMILRCVEMCLFLTYLLELPQTNYIFLETIDCVLSKTVHNIVVASTIGEHGSINQ